MSLETIYPGNAVRLDAPVKQVTLLEDRAQVQRVGSLTLSAGQHKLLVRDVAPVLQDLSLRAATSLNAKLVDARARRAMLVNKEEKSEPLRALEKDVEALTDKLRMLSEDKALADQRRVRLEQVLERALEELPEDVSWGLVQTSWKETVEGLFEQVRTLRATALGLDHAMRDAQEERSRLIVQRQAFDRPDSRFVAWLEVDVLVTSPGTVEVTFDYTVPNALWRPLHSARLGDGRFTFESRASVWQNTGEDWNNVRLVFSTARASLGIEPPMLSDDLLTAQKKNEKLVVQAREVVIQKAKAEKGGSGSGAPAPTTVELPGVDDGGEIRTLEAKGPCTVPSDGRPNTVALFDFVATPKQKLVAMPELELRVFLTSLQKNESKFPILAGPVELLLQNGFVGWTRVPFVAPGEVFNLSFGPDDAIRLARADRERKQDAREDGWRTTTTSVWLYLSNLGDTPKTVEVTERMPVSELDQVKVELGSKRTTLKPEVDKSNGFMTWTVELPAREQTQVTFAYDVSAAASVQGL
jgi:uncharacterized protein (TIGR02231 family)